MGESSRRARIRAGDGGPVRRRVVLCSSTGGVLLDLLALEPWWQAHDTWWVAAPGPDTAELLRGQRVHWLADASSRRPLALAAATAQARGLLRDLRPDVVVSAGTGVAVPVFLAARSLGVRCWWVETYNLVGGPGLAARVCGALAERTLVQHPDLLAERRRSLLVGELY